MTSLGLGTAQFGLDYGATNTTGRVDESEVSTIVEMASTRGATVIDTASLYGGAEEVLGRTLPRAHHFNVVTKSSVFERAEISNADVCRARATLERSLANLQTDSVYGFLVHHAEDILRPGGERLMEAMCAWRDEGLCKKIGVSVYKGSEACRIADLFDIDLVQLPLNVLDQSSLRDGTLIRLAAAGIEVHARSVFLQGVIVEQIENLPPFFSSFRRELERVSWAAHDAGVDRLTFALAFIQQIGLVDVAIVGVSNSSEFRTILDAWDRAPSVVAEYSGLSSMDEGLINPMRWPN